MQQQSFKMRPQRTGLSLQSPLRPLSVLVFHLLLTHSCRGQSQLIGPLQPIVALVGDDIILPCHLEPAVDVVATTLEWTRPDLNSIIIFAWRAGEDLLHVKDPSYRGRTSLFTDELKHGNISLKLSKVKPSDEGRYKCYVPDLDKESLVELVVGAVSLPVITLAGIDEATSGVMIDCRSEGWYPEPEVLWLDGEGNLLSTGPPETVRGPDDLYTVSSRVTVEKRHSNSFTCRVQQKNTNQTRETHVQVPDDFFKIQSSSVSVNTGLAVSLAVWIIMFILLLLFVVWKWRQIRIKTKRSHSDQTEKGEKKNHSKTNKSVDQCVTEEREREREQLMTHETVEMEVLKGNVQKKSKHFKKKRSEQQLQEEKRREEERREEQQRTEKKRREEERREEQQRTEEKRREEEEKRREEERRDEAEKEVQTLKEELQIKKKEIETKGAELQQLHEEKKRNEDELQSLKKELEKKNKELERIINIPIRSYSQHLSPSREEQLKKEEVETLKKKLENQQKKSDANIKEFKDKEAEVQQLQDQIQRMTNLQTQMESNNMELERSRAAPVRSSSSGFKWPIVSRQKIQDEQQRRHKAENRVQILEEELQTKNRELKDKQQAAEAQMKKTNEEMKRKDGEINQLKRNFDKQIADEQQKKEEAEGEVKQLMTKNTEMEEKQQGVNIEWKKINEELNDTKHQLKMKDEEISQLKREFNKQIWDQQQKIGEAERGLKQLMTNFEKQLQEETTKMKEAEKEVEKLKKEMEDESRSSSQSSNTGLPIVVEVNQKDKYIRLINRSNQDQPLGGWKLEMQVNRKIITHTFENTFKLKSGSTVSMSGPGCFQQYDLWWKDFTPWRSGDNLKFTLISNTDTCVRHQLSSFTH